MLMFILCADKYSWKMKILLSFNIGKTYFLWIHNLLFLPWETPPPHHYLQQQQDMETLKPLSCHCLLHLQQRESWAQRGNTALPPSPSPTHPQTWENQVITTNNRAVIVPGEGPNSGLLLVIRRVQRSQYSYRLLITQSSSSSLLKESSSAFTINYL